MTIITARGGLVSILSHFQDVLNSHDSLQLSNEDLWDLPLCQEALPLPTSSTRLSFDDFKSLRAELRRMSGVLDVLRALTRSLEDDLSEFEAQVNIAARHRSIQIIPDEILSIIFGYAVTELEDAGSLSLVCARFRDVVLSSPRVWAGITLTECIPSRAVAAIVDRSRGLLLSACLFEGDFRRVSDIEEENARTVLLHSSSLKELRIGNGILEHRVEFWEGFNKHHLPHLHVLLMYHNFLPLAQTFRSWTMPRLQVLQANFIPSTVHSKNLIRCNLILPYDGDRYGGLLDFLASAPLLEDLQMSFKHNREWPETRTEHVLLPNLKAMTLSINMIISQHRDALRSLFFSILPKLRMDNLSDLTVKLIIYVEHHQLDLVLQFISRQKSLHRLNVVFFHGTSRSLSEVYWPGMFGRIDRVFTDLPSSIPIPEVHIEVPGMTVSWDTTRNGFEVPGIHRLCISDEAEFTVAHLRKGFCAARGNVADVRSVEVVRCPKIDEAELRALFSDTEDIRFI